MNQVIGCCSLCGGDVVGHAGPWLGVIPPPRAKCTSCGAMEARGPVIPMVPAPVTAKQWQPLTHTFSFEVKYPEQQADTLTIDVPHSFSGNGFKS